jgi:hypothetical protein
MVSRCALRWALGSGGVVRYMLRTTNRSVSDLLFSATTMLKNAATPAVKCQSNVMDLCISKLLID